jgi:hypothetical protein
MPLARGPATDAVISGAALCDSSPPCRAATSTSGCFSLRKFPLGSKPAVHRTPKNPTLAHRNQPTAAMKPATTSAEACGHSGNGSLSSQTLTSAFSATLKPLPADCGEGLHGAPPRLHDVVDARTPGRVRSQARHGVLGFPGQARVWGRVQSGVMRRTADLGDSRARA